MQIGLYVHDLFKLFNFPNVSVSVLCFSNTNYILTYKQFLK